MIGRRRGMALVVVGALAVAVFAVATTCDSEDRPAAPPPSSTTTTSVEDAVLAAYYAYWEAFEAAADPPNPDHPALARTTTGEELAAARRLLENDHAAGLVRRGELVLNPSVLEVDEEQALVSDCYLDGAAVFDAETGTLVIAASADSIQARFTLVLTSDGWKVSARAKKATGCNSSALQF